MITHKGNAMHSAEELKKKAKQDVVAPTDYNKMIFQLEAFAALINILFWGGQRAAQKTHEAGPCHQVKCHHVQDSISLRRPVSSKGPLVGVQQSPIFPYKLLASKGQGRRWRRPP